MNSKVESIAAEPGDRQTLFLGIDGGGSKCRARLVDGQNRTLGSGLSGAANPLYGVTPAIEAIVSATHAALHQAGLTTSETDRIVAGVALAGLHRSKMVQAMADWEHPFKRVYFTTDLQAACLGAHRGEDGAVVIVGTGSCGFSSVKGRATTFGAHGLLLGDRASGAWIGLKAVKAVLLASDGLGPQTRLSEALYREFNCQGLLLADELTGATSRDYARIAPLVFAAAEQGDTVAGAIIAKGAQYISELIRQLQRTGPPRISMMGGIAGPLSAWLPADVLALLSPPQEDAEFGAIHYARQQYFSGDRISPVETNTGNKTC